jgi:NTE family protein
MGAARVVAINVGDLSTREGVNATMLELTSETMDAMMRASTRRALASADIVLNVPLKEYGSLDWRRAASLIEEGYRAAEAMREELLPLAVSEADFETWRAARRAKRLTAMKVPTFVQLDGFSPRHRPARARPRETVRPAISHARCHPRERDVERLPRLCFRPLSRV